MAHGSSFGKSSTQRLMGIGLGELSFDMAMHRALAAGEPSQAAALKRRGRGAPITPRPMVASLRQPNTVPRKPTMMRRPSPREPTTTSQRITTPRPQSPRRSRRSANRPASRRASRAKRNMKESRPKNKRRLYSRDRSRKPSKRAAIRPPFLVTCRTLLTIRAGALPISSGEAPLLPGQTNWS